MLWIQSGIISEWGGRVIAKHIIISASKFINYSGLARAKTTSRNSIGSWFYRGSAICIWKTVLRGEAEDDKINLVLLPVVVVSLQL